MNTPRGTPEEIEKQNQEYIECLVKCMETTKKRIEALDKCEHTPQNRRSYKHALDCFHEHRIQYLEATGQIPERKRKLRF